MTTINGRPADSGQNLGPGMGAWGEHYRSIGASGVIAAASYSGGAADSPCFAARWASTTYLAYVDLIEFTITSDGTGFTAGLVKINAYFATGWSASDTGGTAITPRLLDSNHVSSRFTDVRIASTGILTAGTRTLNAAFARRLGTTGTGTYANILVGQVLFPSTQTNQKPAPLVLRANQGIVIGLETPATGTCNIDVAMKHYELAI